MKRSSSVVGGVLLAVIVGSIASPAYAGWEWDRYRGGQYQNEMMQVQFGRNSVKAQGWMTGTTGGWWCCKGKGVGYRNGGFLTYVGKVRAGGANGYDAPQSWTLEWRWPTPGSIQMWDKTGKAKTRYYKDASLKRSKWVSKRRGCNFSSW
ncbi:MAG TPA: hypothetical protein P5544_08705 [Candidatus Nanopelagicales bacterium]|nr:hypothetical protein [Candidatus Nanopelagicales bacterium]